MLCMYVHVPTTVTTPYLEIALDGVIDGGCVHVVHVHACAYSSDHTLP